MARAQGSRRARRPRALQVVATVCSSKQLSSSSAVVMLVRPTERQSRCSFPTTPCCNALLQSGGTAVCDRYERPQNSEAYCVRLPRGRQCFSNSSKSMGRVDGMPGARSAALVSKGGGLRWLCRGSEGELPRGVSAGKARRWPSARARATRYCNPGEPPSMARRRRGRALPSCWAGAGARCSACRQGLPCIGALRSLSAGTGESAQGAARGGAVPLWRCVRGTRTRPRARRASGCSRLHTGEKQSTTHLDDESPVSRDSLGAGIDAACARAPPQHTRGWPGPGAGAAGRARAYRRVGVWAGRLRPGGGK